MKRISGAVATATLIFTSMGAAPPPATSADVVPDDTLSGVIYAHDGLPVPGAAVELAVLSGPDPVTGVIRTIPFAATVTDGDGRYEVASAPPSASTDGVRQVQVTATKGPHAVTGSIRAPVRLAVRPSCAPPGAAQVWLARPSR